MAFEVTKKLGRESQEIGIEYAGERVSVQFNPEAYTPKFEREILGELGGEAKSVYFASFLARVLVGWDVVESGKPFPLTQERLEELPVRFLNAIHDALLERLLPNAKTPESSGSFS